MPMAHSRSWKPSQRNPKPEGTSDEDMQHLELPSTPDAVLLKASRRVAPAFRFLIADLRLLGATESHTTVIEAFIALLKALGVSLLPPPGQPAAATLRRCPEKYELAMLLGMLSTRGESHHNHSCQESQKKETWSAMIEEGGKGDKRKEKKYDNIQGKGIFVPPPIIQTVEKIVEVPVPQVQYVDRVVEKIVEVPAIETVEKIVEKEVQVDGERVVELHPQTIAKDPGMDFDCQTVSGIISAETQLAGPEGDHLAKFNAKVEAHSTKYPGGKLPMEFRSFSAYMERLQDQLDFAEKTSMCCIKCGKYPWT